MPPKLLPRVSRLQVEPADIIVIECRDRLSDEQCRQMKEQLRIFWPHNKALILQDGMTLKLGVPGRIVKRRSRGRRPRVH